MANLNPEVNDLVHHAVVDGATDVETGVDKTDVTEEIVPETTHSTSTVIHTACADINTPTTSTSTQQLRKLRLELKAKLNKLKNLQISIDTGIVINDLVGRVVVEVVLASISADNADRSGT